MKIQSGHPIMGDAKDVEGKFVRFIDDDGRCLFEVHILDEHSLEIRGCETHKVGDQIHTEALSIETRYANSFYVRTLPYKGA